MTSLPVCVVEAEVNVERVRVSSASDDVIDDVTSGQCGGMGRQCRVSGCGSSAS